MNQLEQLIELIDIQHLWQEEKDISRNEFIKLSGSIDTKIYFIVDGSLRIFIRDDIEEHTIRFGYQNNFIVALDSYLSESPSPLFIQAIKKTKVKIISKKVFQQLLHDTPQLQSAWVQILEQIILQQLEREQDLLTTSPKNRYERVLARSPELFQAIPNKYIAEYLRMTPETLSRLKKS